MSSKMKDRCENKDDTTSFCTDEDVKELKADELCKKINNEYDFLIQASKDFSPSEFIKSFKTFGANNETHAKLKSVIESVQKQTQIVLGNQKCENSVNVVQQNKIGLSPTCANLQLAVIQSLKDQPAQLSEYLRSIKPENIIQKNEVETKQQCVLQSQITAALDMEASAESAALVKFLQKSSDLMANNSADVDICSNISSTMTSCQYIKTKLCCGNDLNLTQINEIDCPVSNVSQTNSKKSLQICNLTGSTTVDAGLIAKLKNSVSADISQTATGTSLMSFVLLLAVIILGPPLGVGLFSFFLPKEIVVAFFGILCIIIGIVLLNMHKPLPERPEFINKTRDMPIFAAKYFKPNSSYQPKAQSEIKPIKYNAAKKICLDDKICLAMDFSITKINDNQDIKEDDVGVPVFYNSTKDGYCEEEIEDEKNTYFTNYKPHTPTPYDIYGKLLIGLGGFLILMGMYLLFKTKTTLPSGGKENYKKIK